ncbi:unnamed protein product [Rhizoctonia solani]|uniref:Uncharacterized protein n=1 Tax=Rhizoctonia solani TaxID=456999 RepID=A0A8H3B1T8_9AGAM|nr:unnamed protein product [Rhizoctonia solani]
MDPVSLAVIKFVATQAATFAFNALKKEFDDPTTIQMDQFIKDQNSSMSNRVNLALVELSAQVNADNIANWFIRFQRLTKNVRNSKEGSAAEYAKFIGEMKESNGIESALRSLYRAITGERALGSQDGLIHAWHKDALAKLSDENNLRYTIKDYVEDQDKNLASCLKLLRNGILILNATAIDQGEANELSKEWETQLTHATEVVYSHYPQVIKRLKSSFSSPWVDENTPWSFRENGQGGQRLNFHSRSGKLIVGPNGGRKSQWTFNPPISSGLIGLSNVEKGSRVGVKSVEWSSVGPYGGGAGINIFEAAGEGTLALYKLMPYDESGPTDGANVKLIGPIKEEKGLIVAEIDRQFRVRDKKFVMAHPDVLPADESSSCIIV